VAPFRKRGLVIRSCVPTALAPAATCREVELWDLERAANRAPSLQARGITPTQGRASRHRWPHDAQALGSTAALDGGGARWVALDPPYGAAPREVTRSAGGIGRFGWTERGTALFTQLAERGTKIRYFVVAPDRSAKLAWEGAVKDVHDDPGRAVRRDGNRGPIIESDRRILLMSDGSATTALDPTSTRSISTRSRSSGCSRRERASTSEWSRWGTRRCARS
jgi:hypothetical protein